MRRPRPLRWRNTAPRARNSKVEAVHSQRDADPIGAYQQHLARSTSCSGLTRPTPRRDAPWGGGRCIPGQACGRRVSPGRRSFSPPARRGNALPLQCGPRRVAHRGPQHLQPSPNPQIPACSIRQSGRQGGAWLSPLQPCNRYLGVGRVCSAVPSFNGATGQRSAASRRGRAPGAQSRTP
jgi:hypothetical protein